jgi:hypothetical protein
LAHAQAQTLTEKTTILIISIKFVGDETTMLKYFEYCAYTYRHRQAIKYLINKLIDDDKTKQEMLKRAIAHDIDKIIMYQFIDRAEASKLHKLNASHHMANNIPKTYFDMLEAVLDYESSGYTKPDKPLNAFDTINRFKREGTVEPIVCNKLLDICKEYGLDSSYSVKKDIVGLQLLEQYNVVTEEMINKEITEYFQYNWRNP